MLKCQKLGWCIELSDGCVEKWRTTWLLIPHLSRWCQVGVRRIFPCEEKVNKGMLQLPLPPWTLTILTTWSLWAQLRLFPGVQKLSFPRGYYPVSLGQCLYPSNMCFVLSMRSHCTPPSLRFCFPCPRYIAGHPFTTLPLVPSSRSLSMTLSLVLLSC